MENRKTCLGVARRADHRGQCFIAASFGWFLAWHVFMHAGAISGLAPATGFSLPFFPSGSASIAFLAMLAILLRIMKYGKSDALG